MAQILREEIEEGVVRITLNRPDSLNAFTYSMYDELLGVLEGIRYDPAVRVVILTGAGRGFCAGADISGAAGAPDWVPDSMAPVERNRAIMDVLGRLPSALHSLPQPVIGAINGAAAGVGYALAISCDVCLTTKSAKFLPAFHNTGTGSEFGASWLLPKLVGLQAAMEILLTGRMMLGEEAARIGLCLRAFDDPEAMNFAVLEMARQIRSNVPRAVTLAKQSVRTNLSVGSFGAALEVELRAISLAGNSADAQEKRASLAERRAPKFVNR
jgi:enoyl-CoA hydratase